MTINYKSPVKFPDILLVASTVSADKLTETSFTHEFVMISHEQGRIVATGTAVMVMFNFNENCKAKLSNDIISAMTAADVSGQGSDSEKSPGQGQRKAKL